MTNVLTAIHIIMYTKQRSHAAEALNPDIKKPVRDYVQKNGAKETRTPDPLHAMQVFNQSETGISVRLYLRMYKTRFLGETSIGDLCITANN